MKRRHVHIVGGKVRKRLACQGDGILLGGTNHVAVTAGGEVDVGAAEGFRIHFFTGNGFDDRGSSEEHVGFALNHDDQIGDSGRIRSAASAGTHDQADLGHNT